LDITLVANLKFRVILSYEYKKIILPILFVLIFCKHKDLLSMKTICLIRHAKTSWAHPSVADRERPLDEKGFADAQELGAFLVQQHLVPDIILVSPAQRTYQTATILQESLSIPEKKMCSLEGIYGAGVEDLLALLQEQDNTSHCIFLVGHNPAITMLANYLGELHIPSLHTASACCLDLLTDNWKSITTSEAKIRFEYHPSHDNV
jgi:phosphohistidine phosphatase